MENNENLDKLMLDHEYDGIRELDNDPPPWLMWILYISIIFSIAYALIYHVLDMGDSQAQEYDREMTEWENKQILMQSNQAESSIDESNIELLTDEASLAIGQSLFQTKTCVTCHGQLGEGNVIGPNLADEYWLNGSSPEAIFKSIKVGIPAKGMTAFKGQMSDEEIVQVSSYVLVSLKGSNPANAKEPQGEKAN